MTVKRDITPAGEKRQKAKIDTFTITEAKDNPENSVDIQSGIAEFNYYENVFSNTISASAVVIEDFIKTKDNTYESLINYIPIRGGEPTLIKVSDGLGSTLDFTSNEKSLYVNRVKNIVGDTKKDGYLLEFCSREFISNEQSRVTKRYNEKISDNVQRIIRDYLKSEKEIFADETLISYNFIGNFRKPLHVCTWLASKSVPSLDVDGKSVKGGTAGYLFYETHDGFNFKSLDKLLKEEPTKNYIYSDIAFNELDTDTENTRNDLLSKQIYAYNDNILRYSRDENTDLQKNLTLGTYSNWSIFFDFYDNKYDFRKFNIDDYQVGKTINAGEQDLRYVADEYRINPTRLMTHILDVGVLPSGKSSKKQLETWKNNPTQPTFDAKNAMVQSIMRYNQLFSIKLNIIIRGDFSLRAGQMINADFIKKGSNDDYELDEINSGKYMIASLCHRITPDGVYSSLSLVKDTFGRKPIKSN